MCARFERGVHHPVVSHDCCFRVENDVKVRRIVKKFGKRDERIEPERESVMTGSSYLDLPIPAPPVHPLGTERNRLPRACVMRVKCFCILLRVPRRVGRSINTPTTAAPGGSYSVRYQRPTPTPRA